MPIIAAYSPWFIGILLFSILPALHSPGVLSIVKIVGYFIISIIGYFGAQKIVPKISTKNKGEISYNPFFVKFLLILVFLVLAGQSLHILQEWKNYDSVSQYYYYMRLKDLHGLVERDIFFGQFMAFCFPYILLCYSYYFSRSTKLPISLLMCTILYIFVVTSAGTRSVAVIFLVTLFFLYYLYNRRINLRLIKLSLLIMSLFVISIYYMRKPEESNDLKFFIDSIVIYLFGSVKSYDIYLNKNISISHGVLRSIFYPDSDLKIMEFVTIGEDIYTNVYGAFAVYEYFFSDFLSYLFVFLIFFLIGAIFAQKKHAILLNGVKAILLTSSLLMIFHDYFFSIIPYLARYFLLYIAFAWVSKCIVSFRICRNLPE